MTRARCSTCCACCTLLPAFGNRVQLLCPAWFAGVLCHANEATALETALRKAGDDESAARDDADGVCGVALQARQSSTWPPRMTTKMRSRRWRRCPCFRPSAPKPLLPLWLWWRRRQRGQRYSLVLNSTCGRHTDPHRRHACSVGRCVTLAAVRVPTFGADARPSFYSHLAISMSVHLCLNVYISISISLDDISLSNFETVCTHMSI